MGDKVLFYSLKHSKLKMIGLAGCFLLLTSLPVFSQTEAVGFELNSRQRVSINKDWRFFKYKSNDQADDLFYDVRPEVTEDTDHKVADAKPTEALDSTFGQQIFKRFCQALYPPRW